MEWNEGKIKRMVKQFLLDKMETACVLLEDDMIDKASGKQGPELKAVDKTNYENSFEHKVVEQPDAIIGLVGNMANYAGYIEFGTGELAEGGQGRKGGWVYMDSEGNYHFTMGMRSRPIMRSAWIEKKAEILQLFKPK